MRKCRSLTFKIILGVVLTILPVNLFMIFLARTSQDVTVDTTRASMANTARVTLNRLVAIMENINSFIWLMENSDANLKAIAELTDHDAYYIAGIGLRQAMDQHMLSYGDADAWFFYSENVGEGMVVEDSEELSARQFQDAVLSDKALLADTRWRIQEIDGTQWLIHTNQWKGVYFGAGIQLDKLAAEARDSLGYETAEAYFSDSGDAEPARDRYAASEQC